MNIEEKAPGRSGNPSVRRAVPIVCLFRYNLVRRDDQMNMNSLAEPGGFSALLMTFDGKLKALRHFSQLSEPWVTKQSWFLENVVTPFDL